MKRIALFLLMAWAVFTMQAQTETGHMTFKGIPIDGPLKTFVQKLEAKGYKTIGVKDGFGILSGDFAGSKDCLICVGALENTDLVYRVIVIFPSLDTWRLLEGQYNILKDNLTEKYGRPAVCEEAFQSSLSQDQLDNSMRMMLLKSDQCNYSTTFKTDTGLILLSISHYDDWGECVTLTYNDDENDRKRSGSVVDDL